MNLNNSLLPPGSSATERRLAAACSELSGLRAPLRELWNPATCPVKFLPYLAWAFSVDRWDESWAESVKRKVVQDAFYIHQHKGTISAVRRMVEPFGFLIRVIEWWQTGEAPGTFRLDIGVQEQGITEESYQELERLISDARPCSRHMLGMSINLQSGGQFYIGAAGICWACPSTCRAADSFISAQPVMTVMTSPFIPTHLTLFPSAVRRIRARRFTLSIYWK